MKTNIFKLNIINVPYVFITAYYDIGCLFIIVFKTIFCISIHKNNQPRPIINIA